MRIFLILLIAAFLAGGCGQQTADGSASIEDTSKFTTVQWLEPSRDFGKITEGQVLNVSFKFKNTGAYPLVIYLIKPSCGCTLVDQPEKPIEPGAIGEIKGAFNSAGKPGVQHKSITILANTKGKREHEVFFQVEVIPKDQ